MVSMSTTPHPLDPSVGGGDPGKDHRMQMREAAAPTASCEPPGEGEADDEGARRVRKPYTITKSRESWTDPEHDKFLEALQLFDRDWKKIEAFVGSKTVIQIRSHAQKYFLKVQKNGTGEHLPPPRPKRKAAHPYPHKASKKAPQVVLPQQASHVMEQGCVIPMDTSTVATNSSANDAFPSWDSGLAQHFSPRHTQGATNNCSSSIESQSGTWPTSEAIEQEIMLPALRAMPDFARVYNFLGSIFDPETSGHLQRLREMDPIDFETVLLLMKNLSLNLTSPNFEAHRRLLSSHGSSMDQVKHESIGDLGSTHTLQNLLVGLLHSPDAKTQENAVTAILNLSINDNNKIAIANADAVDPLIHVLETGNPEAKENAAATLFSLSVIEENKVRIGRSGAIKPLVDLLGNGTPRGKKDASTALFNLSILHENKARIVQADAVRHLVELMDPAAGMVDKAVAVLANLATIPEGRTAIGQARGIPALVEVVELGSGRGKENAAAALLQLCTNSNRFCSIVLQEGAVPPLVALSQTGTPRAREKAQALLSYFRSQRHGNSARR